MKKYWNILLQLADLIDVGGTLVAKPEIDVD